MSPRRIQATELRIRHKLERILSFSQVFRQHRTTHMRRHLLTRTANLTTTVGASNEGYWLLIYVWLVQDVGKRVA